METLEKQTGRLAPGRRLRTGKLVLVSLSSFALAAVAGGSSAAAEPSAAPQPTGAQTATTPAHDGGDAKAKAKAKPNDDVTEYRFDDDLVRGDLMNPNGEVLSVRSARRKGSLIRVREGFIDELLESAHDL